MPDAKTAAPWDSRLVYQATDLAVPRVRIFWGERRLLEKSSLRLPIPFNSKMHSALDISCQMRARF